MAAWPAATPTTRPLLLMSTANDCVDPTRPRSISSSPAGLNKMAMASKNKRRGVDRIQRSSLRH